MKKCATKYCRNKTKRKHCFHCEREQKKKRNPYAYWFGVARRNANRRAKKNNNNKFWHVTFEHFVHICDTTGYLAIKGRRKNDATLDCIYNEKGYVDGNIRVITCGENSAKGTKKVHWNYITREWELIVQAPTPIQDDQPF